MKTPKDCTSCGKCCRAFLIYELTLTDARRVPASYWRKSDLYHAEMRQTSDGVCKAHDLGTNLCTIYPDRPAVCRAFKRGSDLCHRAIRRWDELLKARKEGGRP